MRCEEFRAAFLAGELRDVHFAHLSGCEACRAVQGELASVTAVLDGHSVWQEPSPELADRVAELPPTRTPVARWRGIPWLRLAAAVVLVLGGIGLVLASLPDRADWAVALEPGELAPQAAATVRGWNTEGGTRVEVESTGLDPAPPGYVYELWFTAEDVHLSAGTFRQPDGATGWVGVRRADFPRLWITLEPIDTDPGPARGATVLDTDPSGG